MKAILIEDEKAAVRNLRALLAEVAPQMEIIAELDSITESVAWLREHPMPGVIFMDIHLADGSAFEIFGHVHIACPIIFTTAYDEYALKAFKVSGIDYLLKPIGPEELRQAVDKLMTLCNAGHGEEQLTELIRTLQNRTRYKTHFLI
ncbi:MAG: response regulator, partial [Alistipes sp.]